MPYNARMARERIFLGLCSGWSADGVDAVLVAVRGRGEKMKLQQLHALHRPLDGAVRSRIVAAQGEKDIAASAVVALDGELADAFAAAGEALIGEAKVDREQIAAVGLFRQPIVRVSAGERSKLICAADTAAVAQALKLPVVANFAASDFAAGGIGGAVTAWPDWLAFHHRRLSRVVVHLGGIVSITFVPAAAVPGDVLAFDVAPAGVLLDGLSQRYANSPFDRDGAAASRGTVCRPLLSELLSHPHFAASPPKTTSAGQWRGDYIERFEAMARKHRCAEADRIATAAEMIARTVADAVGALTERPHEVVLAGGASQNIHLAQRIRMLLCPCSTYAIARYQFDLRSYAGVCAAVLAAARLDSHPAHCHLATGAAAPAVLGSLVCP